MPNPDPTPDLDALLAEASKVPHLTAHSITDSDVLHLIDELVAEVRRLRDERDSWRLAHRRSVADGLHLIDELAAEVRRLRREPRIERKRQRP
jgi:hypothetical protein